MYKVDWPENDPDMKKTPGLNRTSGIKKTTNALLFSSLAVMLLLAAVVSFDSREVVDVQTVELSTAARIIGLHSVPDLCSGDAAALASVLGCLETNDGISWAWILDKDDKVAADFCRSGATIDLIPEAISLKKKVVRQSGRIYVCQPIVKDDLIIGKIVLAAEARK